MRRITAQARRRALVRRHHLAGDAEDPEAVVRAMVALHVSDPASVYLSVLARCAGATLSDVAAAMYERRSLVRWMAMRRTLFDFAREDVPVIQPGVRPSWTERSPSVVRPPVHNWPRTWPPVRRASSPVRPLSGRRPWSAGPGRRPPGP